MLPEIGKLCRILFFHICDGNHKTVMIKHNYNILNFYVPQNETEKAKASPQEHKLRKYVCLIFYLNIYFNDLQI